ncbi:uncharacterized protein [Gorilla gorilla gorilla]|uniref:uncharacterized protein isoform X1 n=1 Tax=Gorilla gorilla gorilla TaxID=9595 RepID=UPI003007F25F
MSLLFLASNCDPELCTLLVGIISGFYFLFEDVAWRVLCFDLKYFIYPQSQDTVDGIKAKHICKKDIAGGGAKSWKPSLQSWEKQWYGKAMERGPSMRETTFRQEYWTFENSYTL